MASAEVMAAVQKELQELEAKFLEKLEKTTRNRAGTETDMEKQHLHTVSTPSIDAMMTSQVYLSDIMYPCYVTQFNTPVLFLGRKMPE